MKKKSNNHLILAAMCLLLFSGSLTAQISFTNQNQLLPSITHSGVAIGINDMNGDDLDDIIRLAGGANELRIVYQGVNGFTETVFGEVDPQRQWAVCTADLDHNGFGDVMSGDYNNIKIQMASATGTTFTALEMPDDFFAQGSNFADINNDGFLDAFVCNDNGESYIFGNDGMGGFFDANDWIDMSINGSSGEPASGNYGTTWTDFDNDGDLDLHIAKCRLGVSSATDERRINKLFVNDGNNNYTEMGAEYGLNIGYQSWTSEFQDIDNDGDLDCFLTNHDYECQLLENDGTGHFTDITAGAGLNIGGVPIQGLMRDFDNDGFVDLLVTGSIHYLFHNNGDQTFTEVANIFDDNQMESFAMGDLNNDGFIDVYGGYAEIYTDPSNIDDVLWMNDGNNNNWFKTHLVGTVSNLDGVGARIEIYGDWGMQVREVRAGESYGITNTLLQGFGIGAATSISHVIVKWPSGIVDLIENPAINGLTEIVEGACQPNAIAITPQGGTILCNGETLTLTAPAGVAYYWSNGENTQEITVSAGGNYSVVVENASGCYDLSEALTVTVAPIETPTIDAAGALSFCEGGSVTLTASSSSSYTWSNGQTSQSIEVTTTGAYTVTTQGTCDDFVSAEIEVNAIAFAPQAIVENLTVPGPGPTEATIEATGTNIRWYADATGGTPLFSGSPYIVEVNNPVTTFWVENSEADLGFVGEVNHLGSSSYNGEEFNGQIIFDALDEFLLKSVKVITDTEGMRKFDLLSNSGEVLQTATKMVAVGESRIDLNFLVAPGTNLILTTDETNNQLELGHLSPRLQRSNQNVNYPYVVADVVSLNNSNFGDGRYYYFYDWEVQSPAFDCLIDRTPVEVTISGDVAVLDVNNTELVNVFPNPGNGLFQLELNLISKKTVLSITDLAGRTLLEKDLGALNGLEKVTVDASELASGSYLLEVEAEGNKYFTKLVIQ